ncbi:MAG: MerR family transcriptional regulator [Hyphomicrobiaceae bacterium]
MGKSADAFRTISEVATELDVPKHVLRFWELKFTQVRPMKRGGGRRYYRPSDVELLSGIRALLHGDGYTIKGVQRILSEQGVEHVKAQAPKGQKVTAPTVKTTSNARVKSTRKNAKKKPAVLPDQVKAMTAAIKELEACRAVLVEGLADPVVADTVSPKRSGTTRRAAS